MYTLYKALTHLSEPALLCILHKRLKKGKEHTQRICERKGITSIERPTGSLIWLHAASVGEAQSALIIIKTLSKNFKNIKIMVTTGTLTSAALMEKRLPDNAFHQFYPLDHPKWVSGFLNHWKPDAVLWMESELWPNMLYEIKKRQIPALLMNARLSPKSFSTWKKLGRLSQSMLSTFHSILCQSETDHDNFLRLGAKNVSVSGNIKYCAKALDVDKLALNEFKNSINNRAVWLYASTHDGEEQLACDIHTRLKSTFHDLLTIIVPRHPERRNDIKETCERAAVNATLRGNQTLLPQSNDDIYIADTLGELGLFYSIAPIACIGRSFSADGGGGHNPIEAAQLGCAVLHGPNVQNLQDIYDDMNKYGAATQVDSEDALFQSLFAHFSNTEVMQDAQQKALEYSTQNSDILDNVMREITNLFNTHKVIQ